MPSGLIVFILLSSVNHDSLWIMIQTNWLHWMLVKTIDKIDKVNNRKKHKMWIFKLNIIDKLKNQNAKVRKHQITAMKTDRKPKAFWQLIRMRICFVTLLKVFVQYFVGIVIIFYMVKELIWSDLLIDLIFIEYLLYSIHIVPQL